MRKSLLFLCVVFLYSMTGLGQDKLEDWQSAATWNEGAIVVSSGEVLKGLICYNDIEGLLLYRNGEQQKSFTSRNVTSFNFFDIAENKRRLFYSLEYEDPFHNAKRPLFFEVLKEFKQFAILIKIDPVLFNQQKGTPINSNSSMKDSNEVIRAQQTETIYFMNTRGEIEPYLELEISHINGIFNDRVKNKRKVLNGDLPKKYFGKKRYDQIQTYAKENDLKLNRKEDFIKIVDYYEKITIN